MVRKKGAFIKSFYFKEKKNAFFMYLIYDGDISFSGRHNNLILCQFYRIIKNHKYLIFLMLFPLLGIIGRDLIDRVCICALNDLLGADE